MAEVATFKGQLLSETFEEISAKQKEIDNAKKPGESEETINGLYNKLKN